MSRYLALCAAVDPYSCMMEYVENGFQWFKDSEERRVYKKDLPNVLSGEGEDAAYAYADCRMFLYSTDFRSYDDFRDFVMRRIEEQRVDKVKLVTYPVCV